MRTLLLQLPSIFKHVLHLKNLRRCLTFTLCNDFCKLNHKWENCSLQHFSLPPLIKSAMPLLRRGSFSSCFSKSKIFPNLRAHPSIHLFGYELLCNIFRKPVSTALDAFCDHFATLAFQNHIKFLHQYAHILVYPAVLLQNPFFDESNQRMFCFQIRSNASAWETMYVPDISPPTIIGSTQVE